MTHVHNAHRVFECFWYVSSEVSHSKNSHAESSFITGSYFDTKQQLIKKVSMCGPFRAPMTACFQRSTVHCYRHSIVKSTRGMRMSFPQISNFTNFKHMQYSKHAYCRTDCRHTPQTYVHPCMHSYMLGDLHSKIHTVMIRNAEMEKHT